MQAADYLNDEDSLHTLCRRAARWLLKTDGYEGHTASHKYQVKFFLAYPLQGLAVVDRACFWYTYCSH